MKIQFCHNCTEEFIAEFEVERVPTVEESELIYARQEILTFHHVTTQRLNVSTTIYSG